MTHERVLRAINDIRAGRMVILVDDEDRENEGDLCMAAEKVTPEAINFMAKHGRGLICLALTDERIRQLNLPMMVQQNKSPLGTAFTISIEARHGVTTGISAADRATTILAAVAPDAKPDDLVAPGHVFPLRAREGGVLVRTGQTEGAVDLARLAGLAPAGVICEIMNDDGSMARMGDLESFATTHNLSIVTVAELIEYRLAHESLVRRLASQTLVHPELGEVTVAAYGSTLDHRQHLVLIKGDVTGEPAPLVRVQAGYPYDSLLGDLLGLLPSGLSAVVERIQQEGRGVLVCLDHGRPPVPLADKIKGLSGDADNVPTSPADPGGVQRHVGIGAQILRDIGLRQIRVLTNHPRRLPGLDGYGLTVAGTEPYGEVPSEEAQGGQHQGRFEVVGGGRD